MRLDWQQALTGTEETFEPGWVRLNVSGMKADETARYTIDSVSKNRPNDYLAVYRADTSTVRFKMRLAS